ncbi:alpha/beta-hydrolase [Xylariaceae sp. AK1471]|nr:alpha/beta-hydrolase [Xylariaceae sp. AK1471]
MHVFRLPSLFAQVALLSQLVASCATGCNQSSITKTLTTLDGQTYVYDYAAATNASKPTLLLLHGYPSSRLDWLHQIHALAAEGFGVLAPDLLGFGASSAPIALEAFKLKDITGHLAQILDAEGLQDVIGVGHDWGAVVLSRAAAWHPGRFTKFVFVSVGYAPAGLLFDVDAVNALAEKTLGYLQYGYWYFFNSYDTADLISQNLESSFHLLFHTNASAWDVDFADVGSARTWLNANITTELPSWLSADYKATWLRHYSQSDAVTSSLNIYRSLLRGIQAPDEAMLTDENRTLRVPVLAIGGSKDLVARAEQQRPQIEPWSSAGYEERVVEAGHWIMLEKGDELNEILIEFAGRK